jgi:WD40 repeat protein/serine/threonine protein kinase
MTEREIFLAALKQPTAGERAAFLDQACGSDANLRGQIEALLVEHELLGSYLEAPVGAGQRTMDQPAVAELPGTVIGPYKLLQQIGEGGMGVVWMAEQTQPVQRKVALKVIKPGMDSRQVIVRFEAERQALAVMDHVNIARVFDGGATEYGRPYFVMELVHGVPITKYCDDNHLTPRERLELFVPVCQAIQHAHQKGLIHRDIKPSNVMITLYDGKPVPKVIDFGVAKATDQTLTERTLFTQYGTMVGTFEYMSPEQAEMSALGVDTRSDIYSLGVLLYELLTGSTPLTHKRVKEAAYAEILRLIKEEEPPRPSTRLSDSGEALASISAQRKTEPAKLSKLIRGELDWIVIKCLEKDRNRRYETANSLAHDIENYLHDEPVQACPPSAAYRFRKFARRNKGALATASVVAVMMLMTVAALATSTVLIAREQRATASALEEETRAKDDLRRDSYFHRISLAHRELSVNNLKRALQLLIECPEDLREWEWHYLMRLCRVDPVTLHDTTEVNSLAFSPDGEFLASAGGDGAIKVWNIKTGKVIKTLETAHNGFACSVAFHPDGKHLASVGADRQVKVWDWTTRQEVFARPCGDAYFSMHAAAFSPLDGRQLAAGSDGDMMVWDWSNGQLLHTFAGHEKHRVSVVFSRDGRRLASGNWAGSVKLWDAEGGGEPLRIFPETRYPVVALAFDKDGERLATASFNRCVDVWDTTTGGHLYTLPHSDGVVLGVAFSPDGRRLASAGEDRIVHLWDVTTGREVLSLRGHTGVSGCLAFSPDGRRLASAGQDKTIRIWDATPLQGHEGQELLTFQNSNEIWSLAVSPDGQKIASAGWSMPVNVRNAQTGRDSVEFPGHRTIVFCVVWQPNGQRIAAAGGDGALFTVKVWDAQTKREVFTLPEFPGGTEFLAVAFSPDGRYLVTGSKDGKVLVWDAENGRPVGTLGIHDREIRGVVFDRNGLHVASASGNGKVKVWSWDPTRLAQMRKPEFECQARSPGVYLNLTFSPDGRWLVTGGEEYTVKIWNVQTGRDQETLRGHNGDVLAVAFSPDGRWLATAGEDTTVRIWDATSWKPRHTLRGHGGLVSSLAFISKSQRLVSGSRDHTVKVWDVSRWDGPDR